MIPIVALDAVINTSIVTELINLTKTVMSLFSEFPLNVLLVGSLAFMGFGFFRAAKHSVR